MDHEASETFDTNDHRVLEIAVTPATPTTCATFDAAKADLDLEGREITNAIPMMAGYEVRILRTVSELKEFREVWTTWRTHPYSDIDFFLTMIEARGPDVKPHVILLLCEGAPKAMAVGHLADGVLDFKVSFKSLFRARLKTLTIVTGGLLGDQSRETARALVSVLMDTLRSGQVEALIVGHTRVDSDFFGLLQSEVPLLCRDHTVESERHWKMTIRDTIEDVYGGLSRDHRQKLRWQAKKFEKDFPGALTWKCFREPAELEQMTKEVEAIAKKTYQRALGSSFVDNEENRTRVALEARQGWLRVHVLYVNAKPCAYWHGTLYNNTFYSETMGFDREYGRYSPGIYLLTKALEDLCQGGVKTLDFGHGDFLYKRQFGNDHWEETMVFYVFAPRLRPIALNMIRTLIGGFRFCARRVLKGLHVLESIRKFWRKKLGTNSKSDAIPAQ